MLCILWITAESLSPCRVVPCDSLRPATVAVVVGYQPVTVDFEGLCVGIEGALDHSVGVLLFITHGHGIIFYFSCLNCDSGEVRGG